MTPYAPPGMLIWDAWPLVRQGVCHLYFLQRDREPGVGSSEQEQLGHAVSTDLISWTTRPNVLAPAPADPDDDLQPWTGCAVNFPDGRVGLYYTRRGTRTGGREQSIGLALGDGEHFVRYAGNPVITPTATPVPGLADCRDLAIIAAPDGGGYYGYFATRRPGRNLTETTAIQAAFSTDLLHWRPGPVVFTTDRFACVEVPEVFPLAGRWYLTMLTGNFYGSRGGLPDGQTGAIIYAESDSPLGPFAAPPDPVLLGARWNSPISARSLLWQGERLVLYTDRIRRDRENLDSPLQVGFISTPKRYTVRGGRLGLDYWPLPGGIPTPLQPAFPATPWGQIWPLADARWRQDGEALAGRCLDRWSVLPLNGDGGLCFMLECELECHAAAAGFVVHRQDDFPGFPRQRGLALLAEPESCRALAAALPDFGFTEMRTATEFPPGRFRLRLVQREEALELYLNERLLLGFTYGKGLNGQLGLLVDRGEAIFRKLQLTRFAD